ncbi:hypothetical protein EDEG_04016 [Edhazardia aedis USNM 41457]|uniref:Uncharacterized protein n=1 Tax=Edhazardia aedis (strain USNM 41457) TaxID=1003232 RepID=J9D197_EDHAE|nr:hypothetical protein EDEG_04016 [Edhazardia aedis USNM 41457]|eukprot:EJW01354.1 hypothetical protein EDEG_04016 [Edhazardia aedis USNM 41457]
MFTILVFLLNIFASDLESCKVRLRQIVVDTLQYQARIQSNSGKIYDLNSQRCNIDLHNSIKTAIENEIKKLEHEKYLVQNFTSERCIAEYGKTNHNVLVEIDTLIQTKRSRWNEHENKFNESISIREGYERINEALKKKIELLNAEKMLLNHF